jgi:hypothetical protein
VGKEGVGHLCVIEVDQVNARAALTEVDEDIGGTQITIDDADSMNGLKGARELNPDRDDLRGVEVLLVPAIPGEWLALAEVHRHVGLPTGDAVFVQPGNARVVEEAEDERLPVEAETIVFVGLYATRQHLDRCRAAQPPMVRAKHRGARAGAGDGEQIEGAREQAIGRSLVHVRDPDRLKRLAEQFGRRPALCAFCSPLRARKL